jgi:hypothetical protein
VRKDFVKNVMVQSKMCYNKNAKPFKSNMPNTSTNKLKHPNPQSVASGQTDAALSKLNF